MLRLWRRGVAGLPSCSDRTAGRRHGPVSRPCRRGVARRSGRMHQLWGSRSGRALNQTQAQLRVRGPEQGACGMAPFVVGVLNVFAKVSISLSSSGLPGSERGREGDLGPDVLGPVGLRSGGDHRRRGVGGVLAWRQPPLRPAGESRLCRSRCLEIDDVAGLMSCESNGRPAANGLGCKPNGNLPAGLLQRPCKSLATE